MSVSKNASNIYKVSKCNTDTFNEENVSCLVKNDAFISAIMTAQLSHHLDTKLTNEDVVLYKLPDAEINFMEMCRTCMATTNVKYIFNVMYEDTLINNLLMEYTSISVQEHDVLPKHLCDTCISELIGYYQFKKKCLQTQHTLEEIIKYSDTRQGTCWNDNKIQTPFLLHNIEYNMFLTNDEHDEKLEIAHIENCSEQELGANLNEILNGSNIKEENELTIQNNEEISCDTNLLPCDLNTSNLENKDEKVENKHIKRLPLNYSKCDDVFETVEELEKHREEVKHPRKIKKFACKVCKKLYTCTMMEIHMRTHTKQKPFGNDGIEKQEEGVARTETRRQQESGSNVNGILNGSNVKEENELTIQKNDGEISCDTNLLPGDLNISDFKNEDAKDENKQIKCSKCSDVFQTSEELEKHRKEVRHPIKKRKLACQICGKLYTSTMMEIHMRTHTKQKPFICRICSRAFSTKNNLDRHGRLHTGERPYICRICGKGFTRAHNLRLHMYIHTGERPFLCKVCGKGFTLARYLNEHTCIQSSNGLFKCRHCGTTFSQNSECRKHVLRHQLTNEQLKEFQCITCQKVFLSKSKLKQHMPIHGEKTFLCTECGQGFHLLGTLQCHMKMHSEEKPYSCSECGKSFLHTGRLNTHMLIHTGERPYKCEVCLKTFRQNIHLKYHVMTHSGEKPYKCSYCNKCFSTNGNLTVHIRTHTGETPYVCDVCGRGFYHSSTMKSHRRRHGDVKVVDEIK